MRPEEWAQLRFNRLKKHIYSEMYEIDTFTIKDARQTAEMQYEYYDGGKARPLKKGDLYFTPDGTIFLKADFRIPAQFKGKELWLTLKTAADRS